KNLIDYIFDLSYFGSSQITIRELEVDDRFVIQGFGWIAGVALDNREGYLFMFGIDVELRKIDLVTDPEFPGTCTRIGVMEIRILLNRVDDRIHRIVSQGNAKDSIFSNHKHRARLGDFIAVQF